MSPKYAERLMFAKREVDPKYSRCFSPIEHGFIASLLLMVILGLIACIYLPIRKGVSFCHGFKKIP